jgi:hypothetical protein
MAMTRQELTAVRDVIDALLRCPDHVRELLTQWIAPQARWLAPEARSKERTVPLIFSKPTAAILIRLRSRRWESIGPRTHYQR